MVMSEVDDAGAGVGRGTAREPSTEIPVGNSRNGEVSKSGKIKGQKVAYTLEFILQLKLGFNSSSDHFSKKVWFFFLSLLKKQL